MFIIEHGGNIERKEGNQNPECLFWETSVSVWIPLSFFSVHIYMFLKKTEIIFIYNLASWFFFFLLNNMNIS